MADGSWWMADFEAQADFRLENSHPQIQWQLVNGRLEAQADFGLENSHPQIRWQTAVGGWQT